MPQMYMTFNNTPKITDISAKYIFVWDTGAKAKNLHSSVMNC